MPKISREPVGEGLQAVALSLQVLEYLAQHPAGGGVTGLAQMFDTSKSRMHRHLRTLVEHGYIMQADGSDKYIIGMRLIRLGRLVSENISLARECAPVMRDLRERLGQTVVVSQMESHGVRVVATVLGNSPIEIGVRHASLMNFHSTAQGKVALAFASEFLQKEVLRSRLEMFTSYTITNPAVLREGLDRIREQGWAVAPNEGLLGVNSLAAPIFDVTNAVVGTIALVDSIQFIGEPPSDEQISEVVAAANRISAALGYAPPARMTTAAPGPVLTPLPAAV
ncbi:Transcriptional regulator KdgR [Paraburkholderia domus]|uniref:IclR family transcriptional regulator n=1 Tax=Paraburkholderia domus TaxID=2793075 RepID=UPI001912DD45|nr:IclR family transcriptional regulator [Paraburkholderia domus]MBK5091723.1 IclR family transcriptional regulator [Burkholderia sp. R-69927]CAE6941341.1 Transcriptional regulator KdgR [Paraburkholderia domus]